MNYFDELVIAFLKENNLLCRNYFDEEIYSKIEDEKDKEFYEKTSCRPVFYFRFNELIGEIGDIGVYCRPYSINGCRSCNNPYSKASRILRERFQKMGGLTITVDGLSELFRKIEEDEK